MPGTAEERQLLDPFDPEQAIPKAAEFIVELTVRFGNRGLAAAAYNGGPARVASWLAGKGPGARDQTIRVHCHWSHRGRMGVCPPSRNPGKAGSRPVLPAGDGALRARASRIGRGTDRALGRAARGKFLQRARLADLCEGEGQLCERAGDVQPMVIGTRLRSRGTRAFYRVRVPAASREVANRMCERIRLLRGSCVVLPS